MPERSYQDNQGGKCQKFGFADVWRQGNDVQSFGVTSKLPQPKLLALAMVLSLFEGIDIAAIGLTLSSLSAKLSLSASEAGYCASASLFGLLVGATVGGRLTDRFGRRTVLVMSVFLLGAFTLCTAYAWSFRSLFAIRLLTGLGMGGLIPLLILLARDASAQSYQATAISLASMCQPIGAILVSLVAIFLAWEWVYHIGGVGPLLMLPVLIFGSLSETPSGDRPPEIAPSMATVLFSEQRAAGTLMLWTFSFIAALASYFFLNWLPALLEVQGFSQRSGRIAFLVYSLGGVAGVLLAGRLIDRIGGTPACVVFPLCAILGIAVLAAISPGLQTYIAVFWIALTVTATSFTSFALAPDYYPASGRSTGVGTMISVGRIGGVAAPVLVGQLLQAGAPTPFVFLVLVPFLLLGAAAGFGFATRRKALLQS